MSIPTLATCKAEGRSVEVLLWVGCAGAYDVRYKRVMRAFVEVLRHAKVSFATLAEEEKCSGDPAKRAGNELLFQMQALSNIERLSYYGVERIVTACPHCFNTIRNEYPALGGTYEVMHHSQLLAELLRKGRLQLLPPKGAVTYHDPCYLGRGNGEYHAPRHILQALFKDLREMRRCKQSARCCGAGGAQIFKESEPGKDEIHHMRSKEALQTGAKQLATSCPFCMLMLSDGMKHHQAEKEVQVQDLAEILASRLASKDL